jgi:hypothetical protein
VAPAEEFEEVEVVEEEEEEDDDEQVEENYVHIYMCV